MTELFSKTISDDSSPVNASHNPIPSGYVGWIRTRSGTPGDWKAFGLIQD